MIIIFNTDHNIQAGDFFTSPLESILLDKLEKYNRKITKLEVHLTDENGKKKGVDDKRCLLEAHIDKMEPTIGSCLSDTYESSLIGAIKNLKASLETKLGRLQDQQQLME